MSVPTPTFHEYEIPRVGVVRLRPPTWADLKAASRAAGEDDESYIVEVLKRVVVSIGDTARAPADEWTGSSRLTNMLASVLSGHLKPDDAALKEVRDARVYDRGRLSVKLPSGMPVVYREPSFAEYQHAMRGNTVSAGFFLLTESVLVEAGERPYRVGDPWPVSLADSLVLYALVVDECRVTDKEVAAAKGSVRVVRGA